jgi:hypothetical protein
VKGVLYQNSNTMEFTSFLEKNERLQIKSKQPH